MAETKPIVFVVDDDPSVRRALSRLIRAAGLAVATFATAGDFLAYPRPIRRACLVLDIRLPGMSGIDLQRQLSATDPDLPIVVISGHGEAELREQALGAGAVAFLSKPFDDQALLDAIRLGLERQRPRSHHITQAEDNH